MGRRSSPRLGWGMHATIATLLLALYCLASAQGSVTTPGVHEPAAPRVRVYFIQAELLPWTYTPLGVDNCNGVNFPEDNPNYGKPVFNKAVFRQYTGNDFQTRKEQDPHLGILGPVIRAEPGDQIVVVLHNTLPFPVNLEPSGLAYAPPPPAAPGSTAIYRWYVPDEAIAPAAPGENSAMLHYHSTVDKEAHVAAGLFGPIVVTGRGETNPETGRPFGVDKELFLVLMKTDEALVPQSIRKDGFVARLEDEDLFHTVNGYTYCNQPGLTAGYGDKVRWYVMGMGGGEDDLHIAHWHGVTIQKRGGFNTDTLAIPPGVSQTGDSIADNPGTWIIHCHENDHFRHGLGSFFTISGPPFDLAPGPDPSGKTRVYYVAAEVTEWDYAPAGGDKCKGPTTTTAFAPEQSVFLSAGKGAMGSKYLKARYVEYTDDTFTTVKERPESQGVLGPVFRAEVGDLIQVVFRNSIPGHNVSIHPHGVLYSKSSEGSPYNDGTNPAFKMDDIVVPGATIIYTWGVPARAGPGPNDPSSVIWIYHSHVDEAMDPAAGLFGITVITRRGSARPDATPADVDREMVLTFGVADELSSFLVPENAQKYQGATAAQFEQFQVLRRQAADLTVPFNPPGVAGQTHLLASILYGPEYTEGQLEELKNSNKIHVVNGFACCNLPGLAVTAGQRVRLYYLPLSHDGGHHAPDKNSGLAMRPEGGQPQLVNFIPGSATTADVDFFVPGSYLLQSGSKHHVAAGMQAWLTVAAAESSNDSGIYV